MINYLWYYWYCLECAICMVWYITIWHGHDKTWYVCLCLSMCVLKWWDEPSRLDATPTSNKMLSNHCMEKNGKKKTQGATKAITHTHTFHYISGRTTIIRHSLQKCCRMHRCYGNGPLESIGPNYIYIYLFIYLYHDQSNSNEATSRTESVVMSHFA